MTPINLEFFKRLKTIKHQLEKEMWLLQPKLKNERNSVYGTFNEFWFEMILTLMGLISIRDKLVYLEDLKNNQEYENFLFKIGLPNWKTIPSKTTFSEYKNRISENCFNSLYHRFKQILETIPQSFSNPKKVTALQKKHPQLSIDGKDLRNTGDAGKLRDNVIAMHSNLEGLEIHTEFTHNENNWIKERLKASLELVLAQYNGLRIIVTGDKIYRNKNTLHTLNFLSLDYCLPVKNPVHHSSDYSKIMRSAGMQYRKKLKAKRVQKMSQKIVQDFYTLVELDAEKGSFALILRRENIGIETGEIVEEIGLYDVKIHEPLSMELLDFLIGVKMNHWQVEINHHIHDVLFREDNFHKSKHNSTIYETLNRLCVLMGQALLGTKKHDFQKLGLALKRWISKGLYVFLQKVGLFSELKPQFLTQNFQFSSILFCSLKIRQIFTERY